MQEMNAQRALKQTGAVLRARWAEVVLVTAMQTGLMLLFERVLLVGGADPSHPARIPDWAMFVLGVGMMLIAVVWQMLYLGFLRTAAVDGSAAHEPMTLLLTGRRFFWRFLGVQLVLGAALWLTAGLLAGVAGTMLGYRNAADFPQWVLEMGGIGAIALFVKPFFLIPALILAFDTSAMEAVALMRQFRLGDLGLLLKGYIFGLAIIAAAAVAASLAPRWTTVYYVASGASFLIQSMTFLMLMLATVLFLAQTCEPETDGEEE